MSKNAFVSAVGASVYIFLLSIFFNFVSQTQRDKPDTFLAPVGLLSALTLSAAVMAYLFFYQPLQLFLDGKKKQAVSVFMQTVGIFAAITVGIWILILFVT